MTVGLKICFIKDSIDGKFYEFLFRKFVKFNPQGFRKGFKGTVWNEKKHIAMISKAKAGDSVGVFDKDGNILSVNTNGLHTPHQSVVIEQESKMFMPSAKEMEEIVNFSNKFVTAYLFNEEYEIVQSSFSDSLYKHREIPKEILDTLKDVPYKLGIHNDKQYDTRFNPGNYITIANTHLMAAWKMWFGEPFFKMVPKEKLLAFPHAVEIKELPTGQVYVHLFDKVEESHTPESRFRQWEWQKWLDFDKLQELYP